MIMATIVSHRISRGEVSLAVSPPTAAEDNDTSPHLSTSQQLANEKAKKSELTDDPVFMNLNSPVDDVIAPEPQALHSDDNDNILMSGGEDVAESGDISISYTTSRDDEPPSCLPAHLSCESPEPRSARQKQDVSSEEKSNEPSHPPSARNQAEKTDDSTAAGQDSQAATPTTTGLDNKRIPSSSIPHLLSTSNSFSSQAQQLIRQQLSFVGIDAALSPTIRSRDESFAFPMDGDNDSSVFKRKDSFPLVMPTGSHPQGHLVMNLTTQGAYSTVQGCLSNLSSASASVRSLSSYVVSPTRNIQYPPNFETPPLTVPIAENMQGGQHTTVGFNMPQLMNQPPTPTTISPSSASLDQQKENSGVGKGPGLPLPTQPLPPPYQSNRYPMQSSSVQPVLYSAINSLERYNAGSFDNKVMIAKARGIEKQKAFPGVPKKKTDNKKSAHSSVDELGSPVGRCVIESKGSSANISGGMAGRKSPRKQQKARNSSLRKEQLIGVEQIVSLKSQTSERSLYKSKSSGNLGGTDSEPESLEELKSRRKINESSGRSVTINDDQNTPTSRRRGRRRENKKVGVFRPSSDAYTPRMGNRDLKYKPAEERASVEKISSTMGTIQRPNFRDALRRVAIILHQHIVKIERRFSTGIRGVDDTGLFKASMRDHFNEDNFATPRYKCSMVRVPMARPGVVYSMRKIRVVHSTPTTDEIYEFAHQLFKKVQLSSECSIVCLIYVEKLMEVAKVPLVAETWRPIFMCGLLLASKVWQDLSSWNIEFASVYPQFSLDAINRLELSFLKFIKWDLYISSR